MSSIGAPAFGFETEITYNKVYYTKQAKKVLETARNISNQMLKAFIDPSIGGEIRANTKNLVEDSTVIEQHANKLRESSNMQKGVAYFPLFGIFIGIGRCVAAIKASDNATADRVAHFIRGIFEALGVALLLVIPDLVITVVRHYQASRHSRESIKSISLKNV